MEVKFNTIFNLAEEVKEISKHLTKTIQNPRKWEMSGFDSY